MDIVQKIKSHPAYVPADDVITALEDLYRRHMHLVLSNPLVENHYDDVGAYFVSIVRYAEAAKIAEDVDWMTHEDTERAVLRMDEEGTPMRDSTPWIETHDGITKQINAVRYMNDRNKVFHHLERIDGVESLIILARCLGVFHNYNAEDAAIDCLNKIQETIL